MATKLPSSLSPRMIAPAALVLFAIVLLIVIAASLGDEDSDADRRGTVTRQSRDSRETRTSPERGATGAVTARRTYVVRSGDTLAKIAAQTGVAIDRLIAINPSVDPQGLVTGQRIKLRE
jgi:LysM repeat protein